MALPTFAKDTVTVARAATTNKRGVSVKDWGNAKTHTIDGCSFQPQSTSSGLDTREAVIVRAKLYLPPGSDIQAGDRVSFDGETFLIDGAPLTKRSPSGRLSHIIAFLVDWEG